MGDTAQIVVPYKPGCDPRVLKGSTIMVNPGHECLYDEVKNAKGQIVKKKFFDVGAFIKFNGKLVRECDINNKIAENVARKLELLGAKVIYVDNKRLDEIRALKLTQRPDAFIAIHQDKFPDATERVFAWGESMDLAKQIDKHMLKDKTIKNRPIETTESQGLVVLKVDPSGQKEVPSVLVECGNMQDKKDLKNLLSKEYQDKVAQFIADGTRDYIAPILEAQKQKQLLAEKAKKKPNPFLLFDPDKKPQKIKYSKFGVLQLNKNSK